MISPEVNSDAPSFSGTRLDAMSMTAELSQWPPWGAVFRPDEVIIESNPAGSNFGAGRQALSASMAERWRFASITSDTPAKSALPVLRMAAGDKDSGVAKEARGRRIADRVCLGKRFPRPRCGEVDFRNPTQSTDSSHIEMACDENDG